MKTGYEEYILKMCNLQLSYDRDRRVMKGEIPVQKRNYFSINFLGSIPLIFLIAYLLLNFLIKIPSNRFLIIYLGVVILFVLISFFFWKSHNSLDENSIKIYIYTQDPYWLSQKICRTIPGFPYIIQLRWINSGYDEISYDPVRKKGLICEGTGYVSNHAPHSKYEVKFK